MKVLVEVSAEPISWFKQSHEEDDIVAALTNLNDKAVVAADDSNFVSLTSSGKGIGLRSMYAIEAFREYVKCIGILKPGTHGELIINSENQLVAMQASSAFRDLVKKHTQQPSSEEWSTEVFERTFKHLLPVTDSVNFLDAHLYGAWDTEQSGASKFLGWLLESQVSKIVMMTYAIPGITEARRLRIHSLIQELVNAKDYRGELEIRLYRPGSLPHDRTGQLGLRLGAVPFTIGHGAELFGRDKVREGSIILAYDVQNNIQAARKQQPTILSFGIPPKY